MTSRSKLQKLRERSGRTREKAESSRPKPGTRLILPSFEGNTRVSWPNIARLARKMPRAILAHTAAKHVDLSVQARSPYAAAIDKFPPLKMILVFDPASPNGFVSMCRRSVCFPRWMLKHPQRKTSIYKRRSFSSSFFLFFLAYVSSFILAYRDRNDREANSKSVQRRGKHSGEKLLETCCNFEHSNKLWKCWKIVFFSLSLSLFWISFETLGLSVSNFRISWIFVLNVFKDR